MFIITDTLKFEMANKHLGCKEPHNISICRTEEAIGHEQEGSWED